MIRWRIHFKLHGILLSKVSLEVIHNPISAIDHIAKPSIEYGIYQERSREREPSADMHEIRVEA